VIKVVVRRLLILLLLITPLSSQSFEITFSDIGIDNITLGSLSSEKIMANFTSPLVGSVIVNITLYHYIENPSAYVQITLYVNTRGKRVALEGTKTEFSMSIELNNTNKLAITITNLGIGQVIIFSNSSLFFWSKDTSSNVSSSSNIIKTIFQVIAPILLIAPVILRIIQIRRRISWEPEEVSENEE